MEEGSKGLTSSHSETDHNPVVLARDKQTHGKELSPEQNHTDLELLLGKGSNMRNSVFSKWCQAFRHAQVTMNLDTHLIPCTKVNSKWSIDRNGKNKTIKLLEKITEDYLSFHWCNEFFDVTPKA